MTRWEAIRENAWNVRQLLAEKRGIAVTETRDPQHIAETAADLLGLTALPEHPDSTLLQGAQAVLDAEFIYFDNSLPDWKKAFAIAHEIGHARIHARSAVCDSSAIESEGISEDSDSSAEKAVGYGAAELREREANLFALELLLPRDAVGASFNSSNCVADALAAGVSFEIFSGQLLHALLVPEHQPKAASGNNPEPDDSQRAASEHRGSALLVSAGPGTGKTQTLCSRISFLLKKGVDPKRILALTFSNKAAEEMRERVASAHPEEAKVMEIMTFHAFGLNLLRQFWERAELDPHSRLVDKIDALMHLEANLARLGFRRYLQIREPTRPLPEILAAISRAKDELCGPEQFAKLARQQLAAADASGDEKAISKAEKAVETANVYRFYQAWLDDGKMLDFGDLIFRAVRLLREDPGVNKAVAGRYDEILVDEFQDVNRASGLLLKEIAGDGKGLWAVGDTRQSIYRWRGASPSNIGEFGTDYAGSQTKSLAVNYRSLPAIVEIFSEFAGQMICAGANVFHDWEANRNDAESDIRLTVASGIGGEVRSVADVIKKHQEEGIAWRDQAVICRTHRQLVEMSEGLTRLEVPVFYLGDVFERSKIRDLLSLLDLSIRNHGHALVRVAQFPEYAIPTADVIRVVEEARSRDGGFRAVLADTEFEAKLSERAHPGWRRVRAHLDSLDSTATVFEFLVRYLFTESDYLRPLLADDSVPNVTSRIAIYQFARFAESMSRRIEERGPEALKRCLRYVRRVAWFREDKDLAQIPDAAAGLDAVRLLTVHGAKGLEFVSVNLPYLGAGKFPYKGGGVPPFPDGLVAATRDCKDEEEECLFFVALSRARDHLHLSRSTTYGATNSNPSPFLIQLRDVLPKATECGTDADPDPPGVEIRARDTFYAPELEKYQRCPRVYYYTGVRGMKGEDDESVYLAFHSMLLKAIREARELPGTSLERFEELWSESEFGGHTYGEIYRAVADEILTRPEAVAGELLERTFEVKIGDVSVRVSVDEVTQQSGSVVIKRLKTGKKPTKPRDDRDALIVAGAHAAFPGKIIEYRKVYLSSGEEVDPEVTPRFSTGALGRFEEAIAGIRDGKFPAKVDDQRCPNCPHYFYCPSGE